MKKLSSKIAIFVSIVLALGIASFVFASSDFKPATLTNGVDRVAVHSKAEADFYFARNYVLETKVLGSLTGPIINSNYLTVNNETTYYITGTFKDASTTIVSFVNPFGLTATATVDMVRLMGTGVATTTYTVQCGATAVAGGASDLDLLSSGAVATSTAGTYLENNLTAALGGTANGGTVAKVAMNAAYPYFTCFVTGTDDTAFTNNSNTFAGKFMVRVSRTR